MTRPLKSAAVVKFTQRKLPGTAVVSSITTRQHQNVVIITQSSQRLPAVHEIRLSTKFDSSECQKCFLVLR